jgi:hypothetical protein
MRFLASAATVRNVRNAYRVPGFSLLLAGLKAFLENGVELNLVADYDPDALVEGRLDFRGAGQAGANPGAPSRHP